MSNLNIEIKAKVPSLENIRNILIAKNAIAKGVDHQVDTYYVTERGRLKLRKGNIENTLIYYERSNDAKARESFFELERLSSGTNIGNILDKVLSVKIVVDKEREIFFIDNVKFHLDKVSNLGSFMEIEAISINNEIKRDVLQEQIDHYINLFNLKSKDFQSLSYSDLLEEDFNARIKREVAKFESDFKTKQPSFISKHLSRIDHLCYRADSEQDYSYLKERFTELGDILISSIVGGREITTYKLNKPFVFCDSYVDVIELASPKSNNHYSTGFEHLEIVIEETFEDFMEQYKDFVYFDISAMSKKHNPEIRVILENGISVKFHHKSLEEVIEYEKSML